MNVRRNRKLRATLALSVAIGILVPLSGTGHAAIIGPDSFGYTADDNAPGVFEDITPDADARSVFPTSTEEIGFDFPFYGTTYSQVNVWQDGILTFGDAEVQLPEENTDLTEEPPSPPTIAPLWAGWDFCGNRQTQVFAETLGSGADQRFIVQWDDVVADFNRCEGEGYTFEVVLFANGVIEFRYLDAVFDGGATVGITNGADNGAPGNGQVLQVPLPSDVAPLAVALPAALIVLIVPATHTLTVDVVGLGEIVGPGISCPPDCTEVYPLGALVPLFPDSPVPVIWGGDCAGINTDCQVVMDTDRRVTALFGAGGEEPTPSQRARVRVRLRSDVNDVLDLFGVLVSRRDRCVRNVEVELHRAGGAYLATTTSNAQGEFLFDPFDLRASGREIQVFAGVDRHSRCKAGESEGIQVPAFHP